MSVRVAITQPYVPAYRLSLWQRVIDQLASHDIEARVFYGGDAEQLAIRERRGDGVRPSWSEQVRTRTLRLPRGLPRLMYRQLPSDWDDALLVTEMQATNGNAWLARVRGRPYVTFGHGREYTSSSGALSARLETALNRGAAHVLTYLPSGRDAVIARTGLDESRVTSFRNATDTTVLRNALDAVSDARLSEFRERHRIPNDVPVALALGALNAHKRVDLLVEAARIVLGGGRWWLIVAGDGDESERIRRLAAETGRVTFLGQSVPADFAPAARLARVIVNPGRVGLVAVDALTASLPVLTTSGVRHAPEVEYLEEGRSIFTTANSAAAFAASWNGFTRSTGDLGQPPTVEGAAQRIADAVEMIAAKRKTQ